MTIPDPSFWLAFFCQEPLFIIVEAFLLLLILLTIAHGL